MFYFLYFIFNTLFSILISYILFSARYQSFIIRCATINF